MPVEEKEPCEHEWQTVKQRVMPERKNPKQPQFKGTGAYFVSRICTKCKERRPIDYKVEI